MAAPTVESLRSLQSSLNGAMDAYIANIEDTKQQNPMKNAEAGKRLIDASYQILNVVRDPFGEMVDLGLQPTQNLAVRIAIDLDLFSRIKERTTLEDLVQQTKADKDLLYRTLRLLVASRIISEPASRVYNQTPQSRMLQIPSLRDWMKTCFDTLQPIWLATPDWLAKNEYKDITDLENNPTLTLYGSNFFEELAADPQREADFASSMKIQELAPPYARPQFPFAESVDAFNAESRSGGSDVLIVDVGGGQGQYLEYVIKRHPNLPGRKVLQDQPSVVAELQGQRRQLQFETSAHDFFKAQPIKGARFYHIRGIMHDWPDQSCVEIMSRLRTAFKLQYSRLLIQSYILPETRCSAREAMMDVNMWTCCGKERTPSQWRALLAEAGFETVRVVKAQFGPFGIIEATAAGEQAVSGTQKL